MTNSEITRRHCLHAGATALGTLASTALAAQASAAARQALDPRPAQYAARAKRVIFLFMNGGPSQHDMLDYKPELNRRSGEVGRRQKQKLIGSRWAFSQHGESGQWFSELLPHLATCADDMCVIRSMKTDSSAHPLAIPLLHTGSFVFTRPSMGSWVLYGLGTENEDLPGFITINPTRTFGGPSNYGSAFLPAAYQGTRIGWENKSLKDVRVDNIRPRDLDATLMRRQVELTQALNRSLLQRNQAVQAAEGILDATALSMRMQAVVPEVLDLTRESPATLAMYGIDEKTTDNFARQCLLARRFVERGVRFVELTQPGWDHHSNLDRLAGKAESVDRPIAALLQDLKHRGLLEDTLVVWAGEFGREPDAQILEGKMVDGRNHNAKGYTAWLAGGGVRGGLAYGATDELGYEAVENPVHLYDLHATILHLLGLDHTRLTYRYSGRDFRLTDVHGQVVSDVVG